MHCLPVPQGLSRLSNKSQRHVQVHVITLERVEQHVTSSFTISQFLQQQHPRFSSPTSELDDLTDRKTGVENMRGVLETCWDLSATGTATTPAPPLTADTARHAFVQRIRRTRSRSNTQLSASQVSSAPAARVEQCKHDGRHVGAAAGVQTPSTGWLDQQAYYLQVLSDLSQLFHDGVKWQKRRSLSALDHLPQPPRLLTAQEEQVLGTIIQQHRKLQQLQVEQPDLAAKLFSSGGSSADVSDSSTTTANSSPAAGSNRSSRLPGDKRYKWPPPLTAADIVEMQQLSPEWCSVLPSLAAHAVDLFVTFNSGLVLFKLQRPYRDSTVPVADLVSNGLAGLRLAATRYDPSKGTRFSTIATTWISQHIQRSRSCESNKPIRRPEHHLQMFQYVAYHHGLEALQNIHGRMDVVQEVARHFNSTPNTVMRAIHETYTQTNPRSLEALAVQAGGTGAGNPTTWSNLLTTSDLDEEDGDLGVPGVSPSMSGGSGNLLAAAGQIPAWAQAVVWSHDQEQQESVQYQHTTAAGDHQRHVAQQQQQQQQQEAPDHSVLPAHAHNAAMMAQAEAEVPLLNKVRSAAAQLRDLAAAPFRQQSQPVDGALSSLVVNTEELLQHNMLQLLHVLSPTERRVIMFLYGIDDDGNARGGRQGLGVELPAGYGDVRSEGSHYKKHKGARGGSRKDKRCGSVSAYRAPRTLKETALALQLPNHQIAATIRNDALAKLAAAAGHATPGATRELPVVGRATATGLVKDHAAAKQAESSYCSSYTTHLVALLKQYVAEKGSLPESASERYEGKLLGRWLARVRAAYRKGKVSDVVADMLTEAAPGTDWMAMPQPDEKPRRRSSKAQLKLVSVGRSARASSKPSIALAAAACSSNSNSGGADAGQHDVGVLGPPRGRSRLLRMRQAAAADRAAQGAPASLSPVVAAASAGEAPEIATAITTESSRTKGSRSGGSTARAKGRKGS